MAPTKPLHGLQILQGTVFPKSIDQLVQFVFELLALQFFMPVPPCGPELCTAPKVTPQVPNTSLVLEVCGKQQILLIFARFKDRVLITAHGRSSV